MNLYVGGNSAKKLRGNSAKAEHFSRLPDSVLLDGKISPSAKCVYALLAGSVFQGTTAKLGQVRISKQLGLHQETVRIALRELESGNHITIVGTGKQRRLYHLHSNIFGQKQRALDSGTETKEELVSFPRPRLATARTA